MRNFYKVVLLLSFIFCSQASYAILSLELTQGVAGAVPIAVVPFLNGAHGGEQNLSAIIANDLQMSGRFNVYKQSALTQTPSEVRNISTDYFKKIGSDYVIIGQVESLGGDKYKIKFQLLEMFKGQGTKSIALEKSYTISQSQLRKTAHHISDIIYKNLIGVNGIFSTKLAYVVVQKLGAKRQYILEVADFDGYNPRPLLTSSEPIMSPTWSPNGRQLAYVSFEKKHASIYVEDIATGSRYLLSDYPGINGAPAWSPDSKKLALVLSKSGAPNIYVMDIASKQLTQVTKDFYINTEPAWSPNGRALLFTSNRSGGPQIYEVNLSTKQISRISYSGNYNARASYTRDAKYIAMIHRVAGNFNIALLNLHTGNTQVLTNPARDSGSPSIAPNDSMILYDTNVGSDNTLAMVSIDGKVQVHLPERQGDAQDPAWSPYLF